jgi:CRISPR-associated protein Csm1
LFIYSGGDDLFVTGTWNELVEFAFDVYQSFRVETGHHPDITLSGGISLSGPKYPLYQSADDSGDAESAAKRNGRDSLSLFGQVFKWDAWLGVEDQSANDIEAISSEIRNYIGDASTLDLFGIFPFVVLFQKVLAGTYPQSFVQNLLSTAQVQEQFIKQVNQSSKSDKKKKKDVQDIQYFLHLPRVAYTLARLPSAIKKDERFDAIRTSLKSPYNAPYFRAIATWIDLLTRTPKKSADTYER